MFTEEINKLWKKLMIIGLAIGIGSPIIYTMVIFFLQQNPDSLPNMDLEVLNMMNYALLAISILGIVPMLFFLKMKMIKLELPLLTKVYSQETAFDSVIVPIITSYYLIICAIGESVAIFGLVFGFIGGEFKFVVMYETMAIIIFLRFSFKKSEIESMVFSLAEKYDLIEE